MKEPTAKPTSYNCKLLGVQQTHRENLQWAMNAAGEFMRTGQSPVKCPNNSAWFLYVQAVDEPKDFLAKVTSVESKADDGESTRQVKESTKNSLEEINAFLEGMVSNG